MIMMNVNPTKLDREDEKRMLPCRFFSNGFCHRGGRCRFYHPAVGAMKTAIKVPPLPPNFGSGISLSTSQSHQMNAMRQGYQPVNMDPRMRSNSNTSSHMGFGGPIPGNAPSGMNCNFGFTNHPSRNYNDYEYDHSSQSSPCESSSSDLSVTGEQNTFFTHINWREFLAPGQEPPPPIKVPEETPLSPRNTERGTDGSTERNSVRRPLGRRASNEDTPPEGSDYASLGEEGEFGKKLTPREELQMKVKQIAKDLAQEPQPIRVLDSYFLGFDFEKAGYSSIPSAMTLDDHPKENNNPQIIKMEESPRNKIAACVLESMLPEQKESKTSP